MAAAGKADWPAGAAAGIALAGPLLVGTATGHPEAGAALTLPALLVVMPLPAGGGNRERVRCLGARTAAITLAGLYSFLTGGRLWALVPAIALAAAAGALLPRVRNTAALAFLLVGISGPVEAFGIPALPQLAGSLWGAVLLLPRWYRSTPSPSPATKRSPVRGRDDWLHAARLGLLLAAASAAMTAAHRLTGEGHWLVIGILLSLRPTPKPPRPRRASALSAIPSAASPRLWPSWPTPAPGRSLPSSPSQAPSPTPCDPPTTSTGALPSSPAPVAHRLRTPHALVHRRGTYGLVLAGAVISVLASRWLRPLPALRLPGPVHFPGL
ncbi:hypothetical protein NKH18_18725 [Streptomyces sp. M10(2022)]